MFRPSAALKALQQQFLLNFAALNVSKIAYGRNLYGYNSIYGTKIGV